ncbi:MAG: DoxX family protein [Bacteroidetes bacterium]|nr:DoxX family protein [Bacteroidota bacterium]
MQRLYKHLDIGLLIARIGMGIGFLYYHGWDKIMGGPERWEGLGGAMSRFGIDFLPVFWGFMAAFAESIAALMIALGFLFAPMSIILAVTMFVAWTGHIASGQGTPGHSFKNMMVLIAFLFTGPGKYSVDAWIASKKSEGKN